MAITIITAPQTYTAAYNPIIVTASTTNGAQANFRYVVDIVMSYPSVVSKRLFFSRRPDGFLLFDAHRIIENYLSYNFGVGEATEALACANSYAIFDIQVGEEYGSTPAIYANLDNTGNIYAINAGVKHSAASFGAEPAFIDLDIDTDYQMNTGTLSTTRKFLTASPRNITICTDKNYYLYFTTASEPIKLMLKTYDSGGALLGTQIKTLAVISNSVIRVGVGTKNITAWNAAYLVGASSYTIQMMDNTPAALGELFTFTIDCECSKFTEHFRLHFLNPLGGFDAFSFNMRYDRDINIKKANYTKILGSMSGGGAYTYAESQAGKVTFDARATETIKINSGNITEEESEWLFHICKSTQVFWEIDSSTYAPVTIKDTQYQPKVYAAEKLFNLELTIEISNEILSQRQ